LDELYVLARRVLLDALEALGPHRDAMILVGAQAIYLQVGEADLAVAPYTTDGDLAIDPTRLSEKPRLEELLTKAGFKPKDVGVWITNRATSIAPQVEVEIDLLVPKTISPGRGKRAARLPGHDATSARIVDGLEGAVVDVGTLTLEALEPQDQRRFELLVAGPAALLVAKVHKIEDRKGTVRSEDKDAYDVLRVLRGTTTNELARRLVGMRSDRRSAAACTRGMTLLRELFGTEGAAGSQMAARAVGSLADAAETAVSCAVLTQDLLTAVTLMQTDVDGE
jgi:hypothetical protein